MEFEKACFIFLYIFFFFYFTFCGKLLSYYLYYLGNLEHCHGIFSKLYCLHCYKVTLILNKKTTPKIFFYIFFCKISVTFEQIGLYSSGSILTGPLVVSVMLNPSAIHGIEKYLLFRNKCVHFLSNNVVGSYIFYLFFICLLYLCIFFL